MEHTPDRTSESANALPSKRQFLGTAAATMFGFLTGCAPENRKGPDPMQIVPKQPEKTEVWDHKEHFLREQRELIQSLLTLNTRTANQRKVLQDILGEDLKELYADLVIYFGCMDDRLEQDDIHKYGMAGVGAGMTDAEFEVFIRNCMKDQEFMKRISGVWWHDKCAAWKKDPVASRKAAERLVKGLELNGKVAVKHAGFGGMIDTPMRGDEHVHPAMALLLEKGEHFNEQRLGIYSLKINTDYTPVEYVEKQIEIAKQVIEGPEGMLEVMEKNDPLLLLIAAETRLEATELFRTHKAMFHRFRKEPVPVILAQEEIDRG